MKKLVIALCLCFASGIFTSYVETSYVYLTECYIKEPLKSLLLDASTRCDSLYAKKTNKNKNVKPYLTVLFNRNTVNIIYDDRSTCTALNEKYFGFANIDGKIAIFYRENPYLIKTSKKKKFKYYTLSGPYDPEYLRYKINADTFVFEGVWPF